MGKRTILIRTMLGLAALTAVGAAIACGDDDDKGTATTGATTAADTKEAAAVRADLQAEIASEKSGDADAFLKHVTENWLTNITGASAEDVKADPSIFQNDQAPILGAITVNGDKATARAQFDDPTSKFDYGNSVDIVKDGGVWKLDALHVVSASFARI
jgi:hypothetical protein